MKRLLVCVAVLSLCGSALAATKAPKDPAAGKNPGAGAPVSVTVDAKTDPVLSRLALTDEQIKAIDKLNQDAVAKKDDLVKADPKPTGKELTDKLKAIKDDLLKAIRAALTVDQQAKFDAGQALVADYDAKVKTATADKAKALKDAGADKDKKAAATKAFEDTVSGLKADLGKALDDKIGKVGATATPNAK